MVGGERESMCACETKRGAEREGEIERVRETRRAIIVVSHQPHNYGLLRANLVAVMST